eukprot:gene22336-26944_t
MAFEGPRQKILEEKLRTSFPNLLHLEVVNESHGRKEDESHFHVLVVEDSFESKKLIDRHRMINAACSEADGQLGFHSLRITAKTPGQWAQNSVAPSAPKCAGGDGLPHKK